MVSFKEFLLMENADYSEYGDKDATDLLEIAKDNLKDILKDDEVKSNEVKKFFIWGTIIIKYIDIYKKIAETETDPVIDDNTKEIIKKIKAIYGRMNTSKKKMGIIFNDGGKLSSLCNIIYKNIGDYDDIPNLCTKLDKEFTTALETDIDELKSRKEINGRVKNALNELGDNFDKKITDENDKKTLEEIRNKSDTDEEDLKKIEELKNKYSNTGDGTLPTAGNDTKETPKKSEIVGANNVDYIAGSSLPVKELRNAIFDGDKKAADAALDKWQEMIAKKIAELNEAKNNKVEQDSKYLKEEQEVLWEGILQNIKDKRDLKYKKVHEFKNIYDRDESSDSAYGERLEEIFDNARVKIGDICENINNYSISNRKREEYKSRATTIISYLIDSTYSLLRNLKKNNSNEGFFNKRKIENAKEKERENEEYEKSFRGKDLNKKASIFAQNFANTFAAAFKTNQVKNIDDIAKRQILDLIAESDGNVQDFIRLVNKSRVMSPNDREATMFAINWLNNKGLKVPGNISNNDIDLTERNPEIRGIKEAFELIKQKIGTEITPPYPDGVIANIVRSVENIASNKDQTTRQTLINNLLASKENKEYPNEVKIISEKFGVSLESKPQDEQINTSDQNVSEQNNKQKRLTRKERIQAKKIEDAGKVTPETMQEWPAVTTAKCDGLPIGARKYSRAIRRRMNYALNKYM